MGQAMSSGARPTFADLAQVDESPVRCFDPGAAEAMILEIKAAAKDGDSLGGVVEVLAEGVPVGLGSHVHWDRKLDALLAQALMSVQAVKGVEIGDGFATATLRGEENADEMRPGNQGAPTFLSNHAGGILGGISTGQPVVCRFAVKPTSSILTPRATVTRTGEATDIATKGRHDPCVGIRAVPVGEAMVACVIADHFLRHRGQVGQGVSWPFPR
jgi:chorismate synthase